MPSLAARKFEALAEEVLYFQKIATDRRIRPLSRAEAETYYHAALATRVAAWEAYLEELVREFYSVTAKPLAPEFNAIHDIARKRAYIVLEKFNTPNSEN
jgi:hypothetical protein